MFKTGLNFIFSGVLHNPFGFNVHLSYFDILFQYALFVQKSLMRFQYRKFAYGPYHEFNMVLKWFIHLSLDNYLYVKTIRIDDTAFHFSNIKLML